MTEVEICESDFTLSLSELCLRCQVPAEFIVELIEYGILDDQVTGQQNEFDALALDRVRRVMRLQRELDVNLPGAAVALDLLDQVNQLQNQVSQLKTLLANFTDDKIDF
jgi:chaperone modulatory protein CbpM